MAMETMNVDKNGLKAAIEAGWKWLLNGWRDCDSQWVHQDDDYNGRGIIEGHECGYG